MYIQQHMHHKYNHKEMCYYSSKNCLRIINDISNYYGVNKEYVFSFNGLDENTKYDKKRANIKEENH